MMAAAKVVLPPLLAMVAIPALVPVLIGQVAMVVLPAQLFPTTNLYPNLLANEATKDAGAATIVGVAMPVAMCS